MVSISASFSDFSLSGTNDLCVEVEKFYVKISNVFQNGHPNWYDRASASHAFLKEEQRILESGDNSNGFYQTKYWRFKSDRPLKHWINNVMFILVNATRRCSY